MNTFSKSFKDLFQNLGIVVPYLLEAAFIILLAVFVFFVFGMTFLVDLINLEENPELVKDILLDNLGITIVGFSFFIVMSFLIIPFFDAMAFGFNVDICRGHGVKLKNMLGYGIRGYNRVLGFRVVGFLILLGFLIYIGLSALILWGLWRQWILFGISLFLLVIAFIALLMFVALILFFVYPAMFFYNKGVFDSIEVSYKFFNNEKSLTVLSLVIVIGASIALSIVTGILRLIPVIGQLIIIIVNFLFRIWSNLFIFEIFKAKKLYVN